MAEVLDADPAAWARSLAGPPAARAWLDAWRTADAAAAEAIDSALGDAISEPAVARALAALPAEVTVLTASSMPVRDVETFWPVRDAPPRVLAHRGANGIDGTLAAAFGAAAAGARVVVHLGDVALAHDLGALLSASRLELALTVVLVDNGGGGIFDFLPVASQADAYEEHVATPTGLAAERVARLFGLRYERVDELGGDPRGPRRRCCTCAPTAPRTSPCTAACGTRSRRRSARARPDDREQGVGGQLAELDAVRAQPEDVVQQTGQGVEQDRRGGGMQETSRGVRTGR